MSAQCCTSYQFIVCFTQRNRRCCDNKARNQYLVYLKLVNIDRKSPKMNDNKMNIYQILSKYELSIITYIINALCFVWCRFSQI